MTSAPTEPAGWVGPAAGPAGRRRFRGTSRWRVRGRFRRPARGTARSRAAMVSRWRARAAARRSANPEPPRMPELWQPRCRCDQRCLPRPGEHLTVSPVVRVARLVALVGVLFLGAFLVPLLPVLHSAGRLAACRGWSRLVLRSVGVRLTVHGEVPRDRSLLVPNHVSWLDILAVAAVCPGAKMMAKHDVRSWPLIGQLAVGAGTIFVDRTKPRQLPDVVRQVARGLSAGSVVTVFAEGTTWCGMPRPTGACGSGGRLRAAMFQAAIDTGTPVVPLRLRYGIGADHGGTTAAAFLGEDTLWESLWRVLAVRDLRISATAAEAIHPDAVTDRRQLAQLTQSALRRDPGHPELGLVA